VVVNYVNESELLLFSMLLHWRVYGLSCDVLDFMLR
jgi:hypothetical protein